MIEIRKITTIGEESIAVSITDDKHPMLTSVIGSKGEEVSFYPVGTTFSVDIEADRKQITPHVPALTDS